MARRRSLVRLTGRTEGTSKTAIAGMPAYLDMHPMFHYEPVGRIGAEWIGSYRQPSNRQLALVRQVRATTPDFMRFTQLAHLHIARPIALYSTGIEMYVAYEYIELNLLDLCPLHEVEIAAVMFQVLDAIHYLVRNEVGFRISTIRVSAKGHVKIIPEWSFETSMSPMIRSANLAYVAVYLGEQITRLCPAQSPECSSFITELSSGSIPDKNHEFIVQGNRPAALMDACRYALQRKLASIRDGSVTD